MASPGIPNGVFNLLVLLPAKGLLRLFPPSPQGPDPDLPPHQPRVAPLQRPARVDGHQSELRSGLYSPRRLEEMAQLALRHAHRRLPEAG
eukprot:CAMPEP_0206242260 /NCGR_PEP_ID=MMETSP0047_2-20121206/16961_1 /ASSEMBLY_ACC=CAM_ASM_000192 /TAXON_ID=195065 /ORGANISM="Chroomonas mesostigmatica_cf, Strain CCMP1168" /LENGTH=89 /DNA_ID=CAMNT_0053667265 /DNA_START=465 /DNA_END=732 /DNA_ORIENTATION=-